MIKFFKSNKLLSLFLFIMCLFLLFNPLISAKACLNGISVWCFKVMPMLFPFFVLTRLLVNSLDNKPNFMDKFFSKMFNVPTGSFLTYVLSIISGYPMGAKLICDMASDNKINSLEAKKMLSFCSVSGPMFIVGTVGVMMFNSLKLGIVILIANILASLINGLIYRGKKETHSSPNYSAQKPIDFGDTVLDALKSILMVGAYISLSFLFIEMLRVLKVFDFISRAICWIFRLNCSEVVISLLNGLVEITSGILSLSSTGASPLIQAVAASGLIGFGGISVFLQSLGFLSKLNIRVKTMICQKTTQAIFCVIFSLILGVIFL